MHSCWLRQTISIFVFVVIRSCFISILKKLRSFVPDRILSAINLWDDIVGWEQELMGIEDVWPSQMNNHIFAISPEGGYMWASEGRIGFVYTVLGDILRKSYLMPPEIPGDRHTRSVMYIKVPLTGSAQQSPPTIYSPITRFISSVRTAPEGQNWLYRNMRLTSRKPHWYSEDV